jgi:hypothetical protein
MLEEIAAQVLSIDLFNSILCANLGLPLNIQWRKTTKTNGRVSTLAELTVQ